MLFRLYSSLNVVRYILWRNKRNYAVNEDFPKLTNLAEKIHKTNFDHTRLE